jgi:hypothetical protein
MGNGKTEEWGRKAVEIGLVICGDERELGRW